MHGLTTFTKKLLSCFEIFDISKLPHDREEIAVYGDEELESLVEHFAAVLSEEETQKIPHEWADFKVWMSAHRGSSHHHLDLYGDLIRECPQHLSHILVLVQLLLTLSLFTASC
jgi:hypothetical protein